MLRTDIRFSGRDMLAICDRKCEKAWGHNGRRHYGASIEYDDADDNVYLADHEIGEAPRNPGSYECGEGKPWHPDRHNKWCVRECERCNLIEIGEEIRLLDHSKRIYNQPWLHPEAEDRYIETGQAYRGPNV